MAAEPTNLADTADFTFAVAGTGDELRVTAFAGREGISALYRFRIELCCENPDLEIRALLGRKCVLSLARDGRTRHVSGIVQRFERTGCGSRLTYYAAHVVPVHWLLARRHKSRIFQSHTCADMSVPGIIEKVLRDAGIPSDAYRFALSRDYPQREYVVQYRERDMDFIARQMEHEGIFYFFEHSADGHVMVIADGATSHVPAPFDAELPFRTPDGLLPDQPHVYGLCEAEQIHFGAASLDDFNFRQPAGQLRAGLQADEYTALEYSDYPGDYADRADGQGYAQVRLEEFQARRQRSLVRTTARGLLPGCTFTITEHPAAAANREYLATRVVHRARQAQCAQEEAALPRRVQYETEVHAIPADLPYRPRRRTKRPAITGTQTALVVGPPGEEIYTDEYGRIKVQFHWDQEGAYDEHSSCWIRVSQGWAGGNYGMFFLPRVGQEVIVSFLEGNPDRPLVTGSVHNNDNMPPYRLPDEKTRSTIKTRSSTGGGGANEIRFEDLKDAEQLLIHAQKDFHLRAKNDGVVTVERDRHERVERNWYELVKQNRESEVRLDLKEKIGGSRYLEVAGDLGQRIAGNHSTRVNSKMYVNADGDVVIESARGICFKVGGNFITIDGSGVYVMGTVVHINGQGSALNGTEVAAKAPAEPLEADTTEPGTDVTYTADPYEFAGLADGDEPTAGGDGSETETSWIEIELVDEAGQPWPNEPYEIIEPDASVKRGSLDANGQAHVAVRNPGECQIGFPELDRRAWQRR
ncbi:MAG: type VI secretion system tip protein VgrG [Phycisphaerae bacterium]|jgi:type VI secretion system secreted protein VgrG